VNIHATFSHLTEKNHDVIHAHDTKQPPEIKIKIKDLSHHEANECGARLITCPRLCGEDAFPARALEVHLKYGCPLRRVKCASCGEEIIDCEMDLHRKETCRFVEDPHGLMQSTFE